MLPSLDVDIPWEGVDGDGSNFLGLLLQLVILLYCFLGLALVCDDHLVPALDTLCRRNHIPEDVAGATFMAFGSAAPEIIINCVATLQTLTSNSANTHQTSLGVSAILGSGMIAFSLIPAACGLASSKPLELKRRPLARDQIFYGISLLVLICIIRNGEATPFYCSLLLINYICYLCVIVFARTIRKWIWTYYYKLDFDDRHSTSAGPTEKTPLLQNDGAELQNDYSDSNEKADDAALKEKQSQAFDMLSNESIGSASSLPSDAPEWKQRLSSGGMENLIPVFEKNKYTNPELWEKLTHVDFEHMGLHAGSIAKFRRFMNRPEFQRGPSLLILEKDLEDSDKDEDHSDSEHSGSFISRVLHFLSMPLEVVFDWTCLDCEEGAKYEKLYLVTFLAAFLWVTIFSFLLSSVIERWVNISGVPMTFFGLLLVSLGAEIPDTIESVTVAMRGYGSMAVSNCQGTQVINICLGLGLPWLIVTSAGQKIRLETNGLFPPSIIQCCVLLFNIFSLLGIALIFGRQKAILDKQVAKYLICAYVCAVLTFAVYLLYTGQLFGNSSAA